MPPYKSMISCCSYIMFTQTKCIQNPVCRTWALASASVIFLRASFLCTPKYIYCIDIVSGMVKYHRLFFMFFPLEYQACIQLRCQFLESVLCWMHSNISVKPVSQQSIKRSNINTAGLLGIDNKLMTKNL